MEQNQQFYDSEEIDLREILDLLWRRMLIIVLVGIIFGLGALMLSEFVIKSKYESTTKVYILNRETRSTITYSDLQTGTQLTKDYMELVKSRPVTEKVIQILDLNMTHKELINNISIVTPSGTRILKITVTDHDPYMARSIADAIREAAAIHISNVMDIEAVNIVEEANLPVNPSSPNKVLNTIIGLVIGIVIALGVVLLFHYFDDKIKTPEQVEKYLGLSVLVSVPEVEINNKSKTNMKKVRRDKERVYDKIQKANEV